MTNNNKNHKIRDIPFWEKYLLSIEEASAYTGIGKNRLYELTSNPKCSFVIMVGSRKLIKKKMLEDYLDKTYET